VAEKLEVVIMTERPHNIADLYLAPVVLEIDARLSQLAELSDEKLTRQIALESDEPDWTVEMRRDAVLRTVAHLIELHGWELSWDSRGIRASNGVHSLVLGVPANLHRFIDEGPRERGAAD
jgi:hypothetical protein